MATALRLVAFALVSVPLVGPASADSTQDVADALARVAGSSADAFASVLADDREGTISALDAARQAALDAVVAAAGDADVERRAGRVLARVDAARAVASRAESTAEETVQRVRRASRAAVGAGRVLGGSSDSLVLRGVRGRAASFVRPGRSLTIRFAVPPGCDETPVVAVEDAPTGAFADPEVRFGRRISVRAGAAAGRARLVVTACGDTREWPLVNLGPRGALGSDPYWGGAEPPRELVYARDADALRVGVPAPSNEASLTGGSPTTWSVAPALPAGLSIDAATGTISGTPAEPAPTAVHEVTAANRWGSERAEITLQVTPALPPDVELLEDGFAIEPFLAGLDAPVKAAFAPDGRLFFNELTTGRVRVVAADGTLRSAPFATVPVLTGGERGLLGLALHPDFSSNGQVFVYASVPAGGGHPDRNQVIRFTAAGDVAVSSVVIVDDLPIGLIHNSGDLQFGPDGKLYVSVGDTGNDALAQQDGSLAGRVLRFEPDGSVPAGNPTEGSPEWCRGLRNTFDMTFHPQTGGLFGSENGPDCCDELNFVQRAKNYTWGPVPPEVTGSQVGIRLAEWTPVIAPTGLVFHPGAAFGDEYRDSLFLAGYDDADLRRLVMSGAAFTDVDAELPFARWRDEGGVAQKPLDVVVSPGGDLHVTTFTTIWRIWRY